MPLTCSGPFRADQHENSLPSRLAVGPRRRQADLEELVRNSALPESALIVVGKDHRLADPEPLAAMLKESCR